MTSSTHIFKHISTQHWRERNHLQQDKCQESPYSMSLCMTVLWHYLEDCSFQSISHLLWINGLAANISLTTHPSHWLSQYCSGRTQGSAASSRFSIRSAARSQRHAAIAETSIAPAVYYCIYSTDSTRVSTQTQHIFMHGEVLYMRQCWGKNRLRRWVEEAAIECDGLEARTHARMHARAHATHLLSACLMSRVYSRQSANPTVHLL